MVEEFTRLNELTFSYWNQKEAAHISMTRPKILAVTNELGEIPANLKYFHLPQEYPLNLNGGSENYTFRDEKNFANYLTFLENYLMSNPQINKTKETVLKQIYTRRGILYRLLSIPYRPHWFDRDCTLYATKFQDALYLVQNKKQPFANYELERTNPEHTYAFKLRQHCFSSKYEFLRDRGFFYVAFICCRSSKAAAKA